MDAMKIANSIPILWIACGISILVIAQALIFAKKSYSAGKKIGLTEKQMKNAIQSSAITSIGPSIVILSGMLSLLITVGGPMASLRLSLIGSVMNLSQQVLVLHQLVYSLGSRAHAYHWHLIWQYGP